MFHSLVTPFEVVTELSPRVVRQVLFDFDGTLSLLREGWPAVMQQVFLEVLPRRLGEDEATLASEVGGEIVRSAGAPTIDQMDRLTELVRERGAEPRDAAFYKRMYLRRLEATTAARKESLRSGIRSADDFLVPGSRELLETLTRRGLSLHLASGTDEESVREEAELLQVAHYFGPRLHGARDGDPSSSKQAVIDRLLRDNRARGSELLSFGDGYVEIRCTKGVGGLAVGVASDESVPGQLDHRKRESLIQAGADVIIAHLANAESWLTRLLG